MLFSPFVFNDLNRKIQPQCKVVLHLYTLQLKYIRLKAGTSIAIYMGTKQKEDNMNNTIINEAKEQGYILSHYETQGEDYCIKFKHSKLQGLLEAVVLFTRGELYVFLSLPVKTGFIPVSNVNKVDRNNIVMELEGLKKQASILLEEVKKGLSLRQTEGGRDLLSQRVVEAHDALNKIDAVGYAKVTRLNIALDRGDTLYHNLKSIYQSLIKGGAVVQCSNAADSVERALDALFMRGESVIKASLLPIYDFHEQMTLGDKLYLSFLVTAKIERSQRAAA
jgi:hypothetical protein